MSDYRESVEAARLAIETLDNHPNRGRDLFDLGSMLMGIFGDSQDLAALEEAIAHTGRAVSLLADEETLQDCQWNLSQLLYWRYMMENDPADLENALEILRGVIAAITSNDPETATCMHELAGLLMSKYAAMGDSTHLDEAVEAERKALLFSHAEDLEAQCEYLYWLAGLLKTRYDSNLSSDDLDEAITVSRQLMHLIQQDDHEHQVISLFWIGDLLRTRYDSGASPNDLDEAIDVGWQLVQMVQETDDMDSLWECLFWLTDLLKIRYDYSLSLVDVDEAIDVGRRLMELVQEDDDESRFSCLYWLSFLLETKYDGSNSLVDLDEAIDITRQAQRLLPAHDPESQWECYNSLSNLLGTRYDSSQSAADLQEAMEASRQALQLPPRQDDEKQGECLDWFAHLLELKFSNTHSLADLEEAIEISRQAMRFLTKLDDKSPSCVHGLSFRLHQKFQLNNQLADLDESIQLGSRALELAADDTWPIKATICHDLSVGLHARYRATGSIEDLTRSVQTAREAVTLNLDVEQSPAHLLQLGSMLVELYWEMHDAVHIDEALETLREASDNAYPSGEADTMACLAALGGALRVRHRVTGERVYIDEAVQILTQIIEGPGDQNPTSFRLGLYELARCLHARFNMTNRIADLAEAIKASTLLLDKTTPEDYDDRVVYLKSHGDLLGQKFGITQKLEDADEAIETLNQAILLLPEGHPDRGGLLTSLSTQLHRKFQRSNHAADQDRAIELEREALSLAPSESERHAECLSNLSVSLSERYTRTGTVVALQEAVFTSCLAVEETAPDSRSRAQFLVNAAYMLNLLVSRQEDHADQSRIAIVLDRAAKYAFEALNLAEAKITIRITAGSLCILYSRDHQQAYEAGRLTVQLISKMVLRSLSHADKQRILFRLGGIACHAAAAALRVGEDATTALELLELGRGLLVSSLSEMRSDIPGLTEAYPEVAERCEKLREELRSYMDSDVELLRDGGKALIQQRVGESLVTTSSRLTRYYEAEKELDQLFEQIKHLPEVGDLLNPLTEQEARAAAKMGPIIIINITDIRSDALLIQPHQITNVMLPDLQRWEHDARTYRRNLSCPEMLEMLWDIVARPVLEALGFCSPPPPDQVMPHVWWIPTSSFTGFPLHAAGYHRKRTGETVLDRVVSSYASSLRAIVQGRAMSTAAPVASETVGARPTGKAVLVSMEYTPGKTRLPYARTEIETLKDVLKSTSIETVEPLRQRNHVLASLSDCSIFHYAGHGFSNQQDPSRSCLFLEDWRESPLTVESLLQVRLHQAPPMLAYLSACGTGEVTNERFQDESVHLITAYQLAGFRHVIGTLWEVVDDMCVDMARLTYSEVRGRGLTDEAISLGLHKATRTLRDRWLTQQEQSAQPYRRSWNIGLRGSSHDLDGDIFPRRMSSNFILTRDVSADVDDDEQGLEWVPYVHFGV